MSRNRGLFFRPEWRTVPREEVPRTEHEETRRAARDWLRDRSDEDVPEFEVEDEWDAI